MSLDRPDAPVVPSALRARDSLTIPTRRGPSMSQDDSAVIVTTGATANAFRAYHRDLPEVRADGETPCVAATHLLNHLMRALDTALTDWRRQSINTAIADVQKFIDKGEPAAG